MESGLHMSLKSGINNKYDLIKRCAFIYTTWMVTFMLVVVLKRAQKTFTHFCIFFQLTSITHEHWLNYALFLFFDIMIFKHHCQAENIGVRKITQWHLHLSPSLNWVNTTDTDFAHKNGRLFGCQFTNKLRHFRSHFSIWLLSYNIKIISNLLANILFSKWMAKYYERYICCTFSLYGKGKHKLNAQLTLQHWIV
jgi:hypothetical protein